ncbi:hypothetical protein ACVWWP_006251 [Bradyrhizobium sp. LM3.6]
MRWRWPPENSCGNFNLSSGCRPDKAEKLSDARLDVALALDQVESADRLGDDGVDPEARVQARIGILKDHLDAAAQLSPSRRLPRVGHRDAVDQDVAGARRQQADDHPRHRGLARAGLSDQCKSLALPDVEGDAVDGLEIFEMAALEHAVEPGLRDVEDAPQTRGLDEGSAHAALSAGTLS